METHRELELKPSNQILDLFGNMQAINSQWMIGPAARQEFPANGVLANNEFCFYHISKLSYDEDYPHREAFENVLLSLDNEAFNFVYVLTGSQEGIELDIGVVQNREKKPVMLGRQLSAANYGEIIASVFEGNFAGSNIEKITGHDLEKLVGDKLKDKYKNAGVLLGIPSINEKNGGEEFDFQGIDRLINSMMGLEWRIIVVCEPVSKTEIVEMQADIYELYNRLSIYAKMTMQQSFNDGQSISFGKNVSESRGRNWSVNTSDGTSKGKQNDNKTTSSQHQEGTSKGASQDHTSGKNQGISINRGSSKSVTVEIANKHAHEIMRYIDEELLERLKIGYSKGLFKTSIYYMAEEPTHASRLKVGLTSLFQGEKSTCSPLHAMALDVSDQSNFNILQTFQNRYINEGNISCDALMLLGRPFSGKYVGLSTYLTTKEISLLAGLPQKEAPGLTLKENVAFGLNEKPVHGKESINLGNMVQKGKELFQMPFKLSRNILTKHTFIAGVTGSGKTTTCHKLLHESHTPFLVIEPAKTEYRTLIRQYRDLIVFTVGNQNIAPFRINPFELIKGEVISAHIDMVKAAFTSAFPMEASMPQILEEAIYKCYEKKGWNINTNENEKYKEKAFESDTDCFPILSDLLAEMEEVVKEKHFSQNMQSDYIGSLVSRLSNLTVGSKGDIFNCGHSTNFKFIAYNNVILEMEELRSPEDKALLMGFVLMRLSAVIKEEHRKNSNYRHLTLVEEAHRLLSKVEYGDSGSKKAAVETFTDLLAEVRKYGEGLIIVDQIPNKLASEALKNTNTKIIHKILARDDKEVVGDTMLMDEKQKEYLSALEVGTAIIFSENTDKPVHVHIKAISDTSEAQVENEVVRERFVTWNTEMDLRELYRQYDLVAKELAHGNIDQKMCNQLKLQIEKAIENSQDKNMDRRDIWEKLIRERDSRTGKSMVSAENCQARINMLTDFFTSVFYQKDFTKQDILKKKIFLYLM